MMKYWILIIGISGLFSCNTKGPAEVLVLPTIHGAHQVNDRYSYDELFRVIHRFEPDLIGVEIRPEDVKESSRYLKAFYPKEMIMVRDSFPQQVVGIDYYGQFFAGSLLPSEVFKDTTNELGIFIHLQKLMAGDSLLLNQREQLGLPGILEEQGKIAISYSPEDLIHGDYDSLTTRYYRLLDILLEGSKYDEYLKFNTQRDEQITANALHLIDKNPGKRILILVGANHRARLVKSLQDVEKINQVENLNFLVMKKTINTQAPVVEKQEVFINAPVEVVWNVLTAINSWPLWQDEVEKALLMGEVAEGTAFNWKAGGINFNSEIHTCDTFSSFGWTGETFGAKAIHNWKFRTDKNGTLVQVEESLEGFLPRLLKKKFSKDLKAGMEKNLLELKLESEKRRS